MAVLLSHLFPPLFFPRLGQESVLEIGGALFIFYANQGLVNELIAA